MRLALVECNDSDDYQACPEQNVKEAEEAVSHSTLLLGSIGQGSVQWLAHVLGVLLLVFVLRRTIEFLVH